MTAQTGYMMPAAILYQQTLASGITSNPLVLPPALSLTDPAPIYALFGTKHKIVQPASQTFNHSAFIMPSYGSDDLFGHWLLVPERLDMGNLLTNQSRDVEIANLFFTAQTLDTIVNNGGGGITITGLPGLPVSVPAFSSVILHVSISSGGPPTIKGTIDFTFAASPDISLPLSGTRITMFPWQPEVPVNETLEWATDTMTSANDTEQRASILLAARQRIRMTVVFDDQVQWQTMHNVVFDWLPRVWGVPVWWEQRPLSEIAVAGQAFIVVDTNSGDFRIGGLAMVINTKTGVFEALEIETFTSTQLNFTSLLQNEYDTTDQVMPVRNGYMSSVPSGSRKLNNMESLNVEFLTQDNIDMSDTTGATLLNGKVLLDDPNAAGQTLAETWTREVTVIDGKSGKVFQSTLIDRSRMHTKKGWDLNNLADTWRVRKLLHSFKGSFNTFYMPTSRADFVLAEDITGGGTDFRVINNGYTQFVQSRAPMNYVRLTLNDGTHIIRQITGSSEDDDQEVIQILTTFSPTLIAKSTVQRLELIVMFRIEDDKATMAHFSAGLADVNINLVSTKG